MAPGDMNVCTWPFGILVFNVREGSIYILRRCKRRKASSEKRFQKTAYKLTNTQIFNYLADTIKLKKL